MDYYRTHQNDIRKDYLSGIYDVIYEGDREGSDIVLYTIEFQKPHCHALLWVDAKDKIQDVKEIDQYISAELPDLILDPDGHRVVYDMMVHGCQTFDDIRTVNHIFFPTFRAACEALGLLGDDKEWDTALEEASFSATPNELQNLTSKSLRIQDLYINDLELEGFVLYELEIVLNSYSKTLRDFGLSLLSRRLLEELRNKELMEEKIYNRVELAKEVANLVPKLNVDQRKIYDLIVVAAAEDKQALIFVYSIASLLLHARRTTHSRFKLTLELTDESLCNIKKNTHIGNLLAEKNLIIWDESPMNDRRCFETLDRCNTPKMGHSGNDVPGALLHNTIAQVMRERPLSVV
ncbi:DNA helicase [Tanacetum coccineum]